MTDIKRMENPTDLTCEKCGKPLVIKWGRFGTFFACTGYPDCKTTKPIGGQQKKPDVPLDEKCPNCGNNLVLKTGRYGEFTACGNYPNCKYVKQKTIGMPCPECNFVTWGKPVPEKCPECGSPYMVEKWLKAGPMLQCPNADCKHKQPVQAPVEALAQ